MPYKDANRTRRAATAATARRYANAKAAGDCPNGCGPAKVGHVYCEPCLAVKRWKQKLAEVA
jgi:hypothetical protein